MNFQDDDYTIFADRTKPVGYEFKYTGDTIIVTKCISIENPCHGCIGYRRVMLCASLEFRSHSGSCIAKMRSDKQDIIFAQTKSIEK